MRLVTPLSVCCATVAFVLGVGVVCPAAGETELSEFQRNFGLPRPLISGSVVSISSEPNRISFEMGSRKVVVGGVLVWMHEALAWAGRGRVLSAIDISSVLGPILQTESTMAGRGYRLVMIDPGHGGDDEGATSRSGIKEKDVTLAIGKLVRSKLEDAGINARLTRRDDRFLSLGRRVAIAEKAGADLFVSLHANSARSGALGIESFVMTSPGHCSTHARVADTRVYEGNRHEAASMVLAYFVHKGVISGTGANDRGIKRARFQVLREVECPAILLECGFLSNPEEASRLGTDGYHEKLATGIVNGIRTYCSRARTGRRDLDRKDAGE